MSIHDPRMIGQDSANIARLERQIFLVAERIKELERLMLETPYPDFKSKWLAARQRRRDLHAEIIELLLRH